MIDKYDIVKRDALWVIQHYGSDAEERECPGSKAEAQAERIARFITVSYTHLTLPTN